MKIWKAVQEIEEQLTPYGFSVGVYRLFSATDTVLTCAASFGQCRRYFTVDAGTEVPLLGLYAQGESRKFIEQVVGPVIETVPLNELVSVGLDGLLRRLGMYQVLAERNGLCLTDFSRVKRHFVMPPGYYGAYRYNEDTLELFGKLLMSGHTESASHKAAQEWGGSDYVAVCDHEGYPVAVYRYGTQIL